MERLVDYVNDLIDREYLAHVSYFTERDDSIFKKKLSEFHKYWKEPAFSSVKRRRDGRSEEWFEKKKSTVEKRLHKRTFFQIKEYDNEVYGKVYRCYLSNPNYTDLEYYENFFIASIDGQYKIVSVYKIKYGLERLSTSLSNWEHLTGDEFKKLGKPLSIFKNRAPENPVHLKEYEKE